MQGTRKLSQIACVNRKKIRDSCYNNNYKVEILEIYSRLSPDRWACIFILTVYTAAHKMNIYTLLADWSNYVSSPLEIVRCLFNEKKRFNYQRETQDDFEIRWIFPFIENTMLQVNQKVIDQKCLIFRLFTCLIWPLECSCGHHDDLFWCSNY